MTNIIMKSQWCNGIPPVNKIGSIVMTHRGRYIRNNNNNNNNKICSAHISTLLGAQGANPETPGQKPLLFHDKCPGFFYVHYIPHGTYSFTSRPKNEAIMVKWHVLLKDTSPATGQGGIRTHILATPELESNALDCSATTLHNHRQGVDTFLKLLHSYTL